ncbi:hypothetical protein BsWGS_12203 [Bradybaena similaris]
MEAKVHEELLSFLAQHCLEETVSNIDDIVLSYLVGVVELVSQGDDGLDVVELIEMMNAYLPGFDQIGRSEVIDWMFGLASKLIGCVEVSQETVCTDDCDPSEPISSSPSKHISPILPLPDSHHQQLCSKRKGRQLSCSSQDSQDEFPKQTDSSAIEEAQVRILLDMFPSACTMEARHCLQLSAGNMDQAAQLIMDRQDTGQAIKSQAKPKAQKKNHKIKKTVDYKLDDDSIKSCVLERYSFIDTEEDKKTYRPPPPKGEAKKLVRYRDGQVVSMKGERFSEVKQKDDDNMKASYINLKPARKYRFH